MAALFGYVVVDGGGHKLRGEIEASSEDNAADQLRQRGDTVIEVRAAAAGGSMRLESGRPCPTASWRTSPSSCGP